MRDCRGFSLLELLIAVAIVTILLSIALPAYREVVLRAHRVAGKVALQDVVIRQEQYLLNHKHYSSNLAGLGYGPDYFVGPTAEEVGESRAVYRIELGLEQGAFESVRAVPWNGQRRDTDCGTLTLDRRGKRGVSGGNSGRPELCW